MRYKITYKSCVSCSLDTRESNISAMPHYLLYRIKTNSTNLMTERNFVIYFSIEQILTNEQLINL